MGYVSKNQIERARQYKVLDYVLANETNDFKPVGSGYRHKEHPSLAVGENGFYWHSREIGGKTALDYLTDVRGYGLVEAVCMLLGKKSIERSAKSEIKPPPERIRFTPPLRHKDNRRVIAYLQSRGIDRELILECINQGSLYESTPYHNAIFTGKDENGRTQFATMRGTISNFKRDADGSNKKYGFVIHPGNLNSREAAVFEAPIDCLSHQTLCKHGDIPPFDGWRISLGGTSITALEHFLETHTEVKHCLICTDNDTAGEAAAEKIAKIAGITTARSPPLIENDWNDMLVYLKKAERTQNKSQQNNTPERG